MKPLSSLQTRALEKITGEWAPPPPDVDSVTLISLARRRLIEHKRTAAFTPISTWGSAAFVWRKRPVKLSVADPAEQNTAASCGEDKKLTD